MFPPPYRQLRRRNCAMIACLLIRLWTGGKPMLRTFEMLYFYFAGWARRVRRAPLSETHPLPRPAEDLAHGVRGHVGRTFPDRETTTPADAHASSTPAAPEAAAGRAPYTTACSPSRRRTRMTIRVESMSSTRSRQTSLYNTTAATNNGSFLRNGLTRS